VAGELGTDFPDFDEDSLDFDEVQAQAVLHDLAWRQTRRFSASGISHSVLDFVYQRDHTAGHGFMRVRIIDRRVYVRKMVGLPVKGEFWSDRQLAWLEGLLSLAESEEDLPNVDFIVSLLDRPYCEVYPDGANFPVFVFAKRSKRESCGSILVPDHSLMHDAYQHDVASPFFWRRLVGHRRAQGWGEREKGPFWDGDFSKPSRKGLRAV
jgi:hypothetical protein